MKINIRKIEIVVLSIIILSNISYAQIAVKADIIYTMAGDKIENGVILVKDDKIEEVGSASEISIPDNYKIIKGKIVTPGLIDVHSVVGLAGIYNSKHDQQQLETSDPIQPELRAFDAYNPNDELVSYLSEFGVTTINTGHAPGALSSGQSMIIKTTGKMNSTSILDSVFSVVFSLGTEVSKAFKSPGTRPKGIAMLRSAFVEAQNYKANEESVFNLKNEILVDVLDKKIPAVITANSSVDILGALRLADEFKFDLILDGAAESYLVTEEIKESGFPVFLHPLMAREKNISYETPKTLSDNDISFAIQGGYESYVPKTRIVLFEAAIAAANGLTFDEALSSVTISAAKILKIDNRVGSLEVGKDADIVIYDGDPFEYTSHVCHVILNGEVIHSNCK